MRKWAALFLMLSWAMAAQEPPVEWIDPSTGHRVIRLSREGGSASLYFHQNAYTARGDKMVITTPKGLATVNLKTRQIEPLVEGRVSSVVVGRKSREVFYFKGDAVYSTHLDTKATREIAKLPPGFRGGSGLTVNADETVLAGSALEGERRPFTPPPSGKDRLQARMEMRLPMQLYTIQIKTGELKAIYHSTDWLNHVQFSPTDPTLLMFCHEGPWHKVDRIWTIRTDGTDLLKIHARTMDMEIAGHEFFSADGKIVWYDLQTPRGQEFWLAGVELATGRKLRYKLERDQWSVHYNVSRNGKLFAGDGGGPQMVAKAKDGQWIYLFRPEKGVLRWERLVNMAKHDYRLEPNVTFTPDGKWIVFRSNMHGASQVYAVEVKKRQAKPPAPPGSV
ncbi:MAG: oligogalacturonate lyase family protein [Bryobacteraceae bacterium]|jgi:oligogalacturonide lyase